MEKNIKDQVRFHIGKRQFPYWETRVSPYGNDSIQGGKLAFPYMEITGNSKRFILKYISIPVHNCINTNQNHTSLFIEVLLKCFKLIFPSDTTLPPCTPKACTVADKLNKCGSNGVYPNTQTLILNRGIYADQQCIKKNWRDTKYAKRRSQ